MLMGEGGQRMGMDLRGTRDLGIVLGLRRRVELLGRMLDVILNMQWLSGFVSHASQV